MPTDYYAKIKPFLKSSEKGISGAGPFGLTQDVRRAAARSLGYGGGFGAGEHHGWLKTVAQLEPYMGSGSASKITPYGIDQQTYRALGKMFGYSGDWGSGQHNKWLAANPGLKSEWLGWLNTKIGQYGLKGGLAPREKEFQELLGNLSQQYGAQGNIWEPTAAPEPPPPAVAATPPPQPPPPAPEPIQVYTAPPTPPPSVPVPISAPPSIQLPTITNTKTVEMPELPEQASIAWQLNKLLEEGSPFIEQKKQQVKQAYNASGLLNSALAQSAGEYAATEAAVPIATGDAAAALEDYMSQLGYAQELGSQEQLLAHEAALSHFNYAQTAEQAALQKAHEKGLLESEYGYKSGLSAQEAQQAASLSAQQAKQVSKLSAQEAQQEKDLKIMTANELLKSEGFKYSANLQGKFADHVAQIQQAAAQSIAAIMTMPDVNPLSKDDMIEDIKAQQDMDLQFINSIYSNLPVWQSMFTQLPGPTPPAPIPDIGLEGGAAGEGAGGAEEEEEAKPPASDPLWPFGTAGNYWGQAKYWQGEKYLWKGATQGWQKAMTSGIANVY